MPSVSYADDVALVARSLDEMKSLVAAYLRWCALLDLQVTKVQLWWNGREVQHMQVGDLAADTQPFFRMVGVVLGSPEDAATEMHLEKRLPKALETARRLQALRVPASLAAHLWRSTVLPQALYGCRLGTSLQSSSAPWWRWGGRCSSRRPRSTSIVGGRRRC